MSSAVHCDVIHQPLRTFRNIDCDSHLTGFPEVIAIYRRGDFYVLEAVRFVEICDVLLVSFSKSLAIAAAPQVKRSRSDKHALANRRGRKVPVPVDYQTIQLVPRASGNYIFHNLQVFGWRSFAEQAESSGN